MVAFRTWLRGLAQHQNLEIIAKEVQDSKRRNSQFLIDYIKKYDPEIKRASSAKALVDVVIQKFTQGMPEKTTLEVFGLLKKIFEAVRSYEGSDSALQMDYKEIRKPIIKKFGNPSKMYTKSIELMRFDQDKWTSNRTEAIKKVAEKNKNKMQFKDVEIYNIMDRILSGANSWSDLTVLCILACGARSGEVLSYSKFEPIEGKKGWVRQTGVLKQDHKDKSRQRETVEKPLVHITVSQFMSAIASIREQLSDDIKRFKTAYELSQSKNSSVNRRVQYYFADHPNVNDIHSHTCRKIWSNIVYNLFADKAKESEQSFIADMLGHETGKLGVATSYSTVHVNTTPKDNVPSPKNNTDKAIEMLTERLGQIELTLTNNGEPEFDKSIPRNSNLRDGNGMQRLKVSVKAMGKRNITVNRKSLANLGYGTKLIKLYFDTQKAKK
jgi:hypothetical protein